jgi:hypothetical protein
MTPISTACDVKLPSVYTIIGDAVYLRTSPAGTIALDVLGNPLYLTAGEVVVANCNAEHWCALVGERAGLYFWQGCAENDEGLSCEPLP